MTREDIIKLAREAGILEPIDLLKSNQWQQDTIRELERFAALVAAAERDARIEAQKRIEALQAENIRNEADRLAAVLNEREACARKTEEFARKWWSIHCDTNKCLVITSQAHNDFCALQAAIRARGQA